jgi:membrane protease YdiL (CAAX protease family)
MIFPDPPENNIPPHDLEPEITPVVDGIVEPVLEPAVEPVFDTYAEGVEPVIGPVAEPIVSTDGLGPSTPTDRAASDALGLWSWTDLVLFLAFAALAFLLASIFASLGYIAINGIGQPTPESIAKNPIFPISLELLFYALLVFSVYVLVVVYHRRPFWASLHWRKPTVGKSIGYFMGGLMMALTVSLAPILLPDKQDFPLEQMFSSPRAAYAMAAFAVLIAPFMEEFVFRGVLFAIFERRVGIRFAIITTALLFAALHIEEYQGAWNHLFLILLVSVVFSLARGLTGSLTPSVILHFAYNFTLIAALYFGTHHFRTFPGAPAFVFF